MYMLNFHLVWADKQRPFRAHPRAMLMVDREGGGVGVLEGRKLLDGEVLSVQRLYLARTVYQLPLFQLLMTCVRVFPLKAPRGRNRGNKGLLHSSVLMSSFPSSFFFICPFFRRREMSQSEGSAQSCNSCIKAYFFVPFLVLHLFKSAKLCAASVPHWLDNQKSVWDVNEQLFYCSTYRWLFMICVYSRPEAHRGS